MIKIGDTLPNLPLRKLSGTTIEEVNLNEQIKGKKVVLFAVPGAFTPTCSRYTYPALLHKQMP